MNVSTGSGSGKSNEVDEVDGYHSFPSAPAADRAERDVAWGFWLRATLRDAHA